MKKIKVKDGTEEELSWEDIDRITNHMWPNAVADVLGYYEKRGIIKGDYFYFTSLPGGWRVEIDRGKE